MGLELEGSYAPHCITSTGAGFRNPPSTESRFSPTPHAAWSYVGLCHLMHRVRGPELQALAL